MNKEYTYADNQIIVSNENGELRRIEPYDNVDMLLAQENIVEGIDNKIKDITDRRDNIQKRDKFAKTKNSLKITAGLSIGSYIGYLICKYILFGPLLVPTMFGTISSPLIFFYILTGAGLISNILMLADDIDEKRIDNKTVNGLNSSLYYLCQEKGKAEVVLERLNNKKTVTEVNEPKLTSITVYKPEILKEIEDYSKVRYNLGGWFKDYYKKYKKGKLEKKLASDNEKYLLPKYEEVIEEEGPRLVKNFKSQR